MSRLLLLVLLSFAIPDVSRVFGKVYHIRRRSAELASPSRISLLDDVPTEIDDDIGGHEVNGGLRRRFKRSDNDRLLVNVSTLRDEGHNEAIVHWSGQNSLVMFLLTRRTNRNGTTINSTLYRSDDYGSSFTSIQQKLSNPAAVIHYYYVCPSNRDKLVFVDLLHKKLYGTTDEGSSFDESFVPFSPDRLFFHPTQQDYILAYTYNDRTLHASFDLGHTWTLVYARVNPRFYWYVAGHDSDTSTVHLEAEDTTTGKYRYHALKKPYPTEVQIDSDFGYVDVGSVVVQNDYIFVQKTTSFASHLYVSYQRKPFKRCFFPNSAHPADFAIVEADESQVFIAASHSGGSVILYLSDITGQFYVKSLDHVVAYVYRNNFLLDLYEVQGLPGTYIVNQYRMFGQHPQTLITFNQGGYWSPIVAPDMDAHGHPTNCNMANCSLYLHLQIDPLMHRIPRPMSDVNAPGVILAQGVLTNSRESTVFMSQNGGLNWTAVMKGNYRKSILDQGGAIVMIPTSATHPDITYILYSCTEGKTWENYTLPLGGRRIKADGLLNEPGITTLITSIYGHASEHEVGRGTAWIVAKIDFSRILSRRCNASDYYKWYPTSGLTQGFCLLGQTLVYERRLASVECFNGKNYERFINATPCVCAREDFECDYGYELNGEDCVAASWFNASVPVTTCEVGSIYLNSSGYRKVATDKCQGGPLVDRYKSMKVNCPVMKPAGLSIEVIPADVVPVGSNVSFRLSQDQGSRKASVTNYTWTFSDGSDKGPVPGYFSAKSQQHVFHKPGLYIVRVMADNSKGSAETAVRVWVKDKLSGLYLTISHAIKINSPATFEIVPIMKDSHAPAPTSNIHYLWLFGDEDADEKAELSWLPTASHTYTTLDNFTILVEAFTGVGSVFLTTTVPVYGTLTTVELTLSGVKMPRGFVDTIFEDIVRRSLHQVLTFKLKVDESRLIVSYDQVTPTLATVSVLPQKQTMMSDSTIDEIVDQLLTKVANGSVHFELPDLSYGYSGKITVTGASIKLDDQDSSKSIVGIAVGVPVGVLVLAACVVLLFIYRKKLQRTRHYSVLHSRYRDNNPDMVSNLLEESDDDDALIDPSNLESSAHHRLALSEQHDDDDPLCARIIMSESGGRGESNDPTNC